MNTCIHSYIYELMEIFGENISIVYELKRFIYDARINSVILEGKLLNKFHIKLLFYVILTECYCMLF